MPTAYSDTNAFSMQEKNQTGCPKLHEELLKISIFCKQQLITQHLSQYKYNLSSL